jgi:hypothetical protein
MIAWDAGLFDDPALVVHHIDLDKLNNDPANLAIMTAEEHSALHAALRPTPTHCPQGHPYSEENTFLNTRGVKRCRICVRLSANATNEKKRKAKRAAGWVPFARQRGPLTDDEVREIRASTEGIDVLAERYAISRSTASNIRNRVTRAGVPDSR